MAEMAELMRNKTGLHHGENYHEFCRLLGRIKANFQLTEFVKYSGFVEWLRYAADFTVTSIENWQWSKNR
jgi:exportin-7|tara:strand:- start:268 stop:477 length:210 start_codon:yes stop_codon:yes gene_type:complete